MKLLTGKRIGQSGGELTRAVLFSFISHVIFFSAVLFLVVGMLSTKDPVAFLKPLAPLLEDLNAVAIPGDHASLSAEDCVKAGAQVGLISSAFPSVEAALRAVVDSHDDGPPCRVLICGSLYLAGTVLAENG